MFPDDNFKLLASADYGDGFVVMLYKAGPNKYCVSERTSWGKTERILSLDPDRALKTYQEMPIKMVGMDEAFPSTE